MAPLVAAIVALVMTTWKKGREELYRNLIDARLPIESFLADLPRSHTPRVSGTAVFMTLSPLGTPRTLLHNVKHNHVLHEQVVFSIMAKDAPIVPAGERIKFRIWARLLPC